MLHILHLEDSPDDAFLIKQALVDHQLDVEVAQVTSRADFLAALERDGFDLILADSSLPGLDGTAALKLARERYPDVPMIAVSGAVDEKRAEAVLSVGASNCVLKDDLWQLVALVRSEEEKLRLLRKTRGMERLVQAVQELSLARDLAAIQVIVRRAARELTGADGASFVLRDGECCYYADEDAIKPLWKGQRFPLKICVSGWVMLNRQAAIIPDIYDDPRVPTEAYRPTFVKSMAMVPIRAAQPIAAIGNYWAKPRKPTPEEIELLQALANTTAVAMENVQVYSELEKRVKDRTAELEAANRELETFSYAVSHDLRAPLRSIRGFTEMVLNKGAAQLDDANRGYLQRVQNSGARMSTLIEDLLKLAKYSRAPLEKRTVDLSALAREIAARLTAAAPNPAATVRIADGLSVEGDAGLLQSALENLLSNAWKYSSRNPAPVIEFNAMPAAAGTRTFFVRDNGAGFDMAAAEKLFQPFQRLHTEQEFTGTGVGLATVQRIIQRHGGRIWAESAVGQGATFYFELPA
jgi:signal transduction histidine kinase/FixJ family two-component response regulator